MNHGNRSGEDQGLAPETASTGIGRVLATNGEAPPKAFGRDSQIRTLVRWAEAQGRILDRDDWLEPASKGGVEHDIWLDAQSQRVIKITLPPGYGRARRLLDGRVNSYWARPLTYLDRWETCNRLFGDDVRLHGVILDDDGPRIVISQPLVVGERPSLRDIREWMQLLGYQSTSYDHTFIHPRSSEGFFDCHAGNYLRGPLVNFMPSTSFPSRSIVPCERC